jgi:hypothetical protein
MKKLLCLLGCAILMLFLVNSCGKDKDFDASSLHGKWVEKKNYEVYNADGTGKTWNEAEDVSESEAKKFTWELSKKELTRIYGMEMGQAKIPEVCTVTELTSSTFKYKDGGGDSHSFVKVN